MNRLLCLIISTLLVLSFTGLVSSLDFADAEKQWRDLTVTNGLTYCYMSELPSSGGNAETIVYIYEGAVVLRLFQSPTNRWNEYLPMDPEELDVLRKTDPQMEFGVLGDHVGDDIAAALTIDRVFQLCYDDYYSKPNAEFLWDQKSLTCGIGSPSSTSFKGINIASIVFPPGQCFLSSERPNVRNPQQANPQLTVPNDKPIVTSCSNLPGGITNCDYGWIKPATLTVDSEVVYPLYALRDQSIRVAEVTFKQSLSQRVLVNDVVLEPPHDDAISAYLLLELENRQVNAVPWGIRVSFLIPFSSQFSASDLEIVQVLGSGDATHSPHVENQSGHHKVTVVMTEFPVKLYVRRKPVAPSIKANNAQQALQHQQEKEEQYRQQILTNNNNNNDNNNAIEASQATIGIESILILVGVVVLLGYFYYRRSSSKRTVNRYHLPIHKVKD